METEETKKGKKKLMKAILAAIKESDLNPMDIVATLTQATHLAAESLVKVLGRPR